MQYFVNPRGRHLVVVVVPEGSPPPMEAGMTKVHSQTAIDCDLQDGQRLSPQQFAALRSKSVSGFLGLGVGDDSVASVAQASSPARQSSTMRRAGGVARVVEVVCWLFLVASVVLGIAVAAQTRVNQFTGESDHPFVATGIAMAIFGAFQALVVVMVAAYIRARSESSGM